MKNLTLISLLAGFGLMGCVTAKPVMDASSKKSLTEALSSTKRAERNRLRDPSRRPAQTLEFFGITDSMTVVEIWPGGGWYAEILGPYLKNKGKYVAAGHNSKSEVSYYRKSSERFRNLVASRSDEFGTNVAIGDFEPPTATNFIAPGTADAVLTFRNVHNWMSRGSQQAAFNSFFTALKSGGILGVVEHRAATDVPQDPKAKNGYVRQDYVIELAKKAGFKLAATSEINANSKDTKNHPKGVWTLPPSLAEKDNMRAKYIAIGESDRMTLKFVKP